MIKKTNVFAKRQSTKNKDSDVKIARKSKRTAWNVTKKKGHALSVINRRPTLIVMASASYARMALL